MSDRYLLYIDLLGFSDMTKNDPRKVARLYSIVDSLNVHSTGNSNVYKTIVFSDTILVYNRHEPKNDAERDGLVWYLIEFVEDLHHRLTGQDAYFRAVICSGNFDHYTLKNIDCFYGGALIEAYNSEKEIDCAGLFISQSCNVHNKYFRTEKYNNEFDFVYLNRHLERLDEHAGGNYPCQTPNMYDVAPYAHYQVRYLADLHRTMRAHPAPRARAKLLSNWDFHARRYPRMTEFLVQNNFDIHLLTPETDWSESFEVMDRDIKYHKRIGAGTPHSISINRKPRKRRSQ